MTDDLGQETANVFDDLSCAVEHGVNDDRDMFHVEVSLGESGPRVMYVFAKSTAGARNAVTNVTIDVRRYTRQERQRMVNDRFKQLLLVEQEVQPAMNTAQAADAKAPTLRAMVGKSE